MELAERGRASFVVTAFLNLLGKPVLDFHMCIYKLQFKSKFLLCHELQSFIKNSDKNWDPSPSD